MPCSWTGFANQGFYNRSLVDHIHRGQPQTVRVQFLHRPQTPWLLLARLQGGPTRADTELAGESRPACVRAATNDVPGHARPMQRIQITLHQHAKREETVVSIEGRRRRKKTPSRNFDPLFKISRAARFLMHLIYYPPPSLSFTFLLFLPTIVSPRSKA